MNGQRRKLGYEQLEDRCMLATFTVNVDYDAAAPFNLADNIVTLREALFRANQVDDADTILFHSDLNGGIITLGKDDQGNSISTGELLITEAVTINAKNSSGTPLLTIDASGNDNNVNVNDGGGSRVFNIDLDPGNDEQQEVRLIGLKITGGDTAGSGGGIHFDGDAINHANALAKLIIQDSEITGNHSHSTFAYSGGGGVFISSDHFGADTTSVSVHIVNSKITGNTTNTTTGSSSDGGGVRVYASDTQVLIEDSEITDNKSVNGGGLFIEGTAFNAETSATIRNTIISGNETISVNDGFQGFGHGGGLHADFNGDGVSVYAQLAIHDSTISGNNASTKGGGAYIQLDNFAKATISNSIITGNDAAGVSTVHAFKDGGGGLYLRISEDIAARYAEATISNTTISGNTAVNDGGGVFALLFGDDESIDDPGAVTLKIQNSTISGNTTQNLSGGGVYVCEKHGAIFEVDQTTISGNKALLGNGGGLALGRSGGSLQPFRATIERSTITKNYSPNGGGLFSAITPQAVDAILDHTIVSGNLTAPSGGSANNIAGAIDEAMSTYNLWGPSSATLPTGNGNIDNTNNDPELHDLAFNGGFARTETHLPMAGGPVIDAGDDTITGEPDHDQRGIGFERVVGSQIDIGAVEYRVGAPRVVDLVISGSASMHKPFSFAQATYDHPNTTEVETDQLIGTGHQLNNVPVGFADTFEIHFDEKILVSSITKDSLEIIGLRHGKVGKIVENTFALHADGYSASWQFEELGLGDHFLIRLDDSVTDLEGNNLDGEWTNPGAISTENSEISEFPSGDRSAGGDFNFVALVLPGDLNLDGTVNALDADPMFANWAATIPLAQALFGLGDIDGDGFINAVDAGQMFVNWSPSFDPNDPYSSFTVLVLGGDVQGSNWTVDQNDYDAYDANPSQYDLNGDGSFGDSLDDAIMEAQFDFLIVIDVVM